jgi:hypothetical protein
MTDDDVRKLAGHPDAIPQICIEWFLKGWRACEQNAPIRNNICKCCGKNMEAHPAPDYHVCTNPYCDNYIKIVKVEDDKKKKEDDDSNFVVTQNDELNK